MRPQTPADVSYSVDYLAEAQSGLLVDGFLAAVIARFHPNMD